MKRLLNRITSIDRRDLLWIVGGTLFVTLGTAGITYGSLTAINAFIEPLMR